MLVFKCIFIFFPHFILFLSSLLLPPLQHLHNIRYQSLIFWFDSLHFKGFLWYIFIKWSLVADWRGIWDVCIVSLVVLSCKSCITFSVISFTSINGNTAYLILLCFILLHFTYIVFSTNWRFVPTLHRASFFF